MHEYGSTVIGNKRLFGGTQNEPDINPDIHHGWITHRRWKMYRSTIFRPLWIMGKGSSTSNGEDNSQNRSKYQYDWRPNKIILKSGTICHFQNGFCVDNEDGHPFWHSFPSSTCKFGRYDVLYEGLASKITDTSQTEEKSPSVYALTTQDITFALTPTGE